MRKIPEKRGLYCLSNRGHTPPFPGTQKKYFVNHRKPRYVGGQFLLNATIEVTTRT